ncbi:hypothetical protein CBI33_21375 [Rhodococcus erythropolis]|nr:hypothetical protein CBI33_21375 [Rhodococcus erythropolis]
MFEYDCCMDSRDAWQLDGEGLKGEVLDLVRARHELQSHGYRGLSPSAIRQSETAVPCGSETEKVPSGMFDA